MDYDPDKIETAWRERWEEEGRYEADPSDEGDATFVTVPYPYPSGGMHIGHARTYTVPDVYARYRRQRGDNVLFPIAWHVTGTPIIGAVERLKNEEPEQMSVLRDTYNVSKDTLADLKTPMGYARHFIEQHYKQGMHDLGLSIDWRREFTTNDERYSKFVTWQYETLRDAGRLEKGLHPVKYCTNEEQPVTTHDLLEGEEAEFQEYTLIRFAHRETIVPMATLRPETVRGVTNAYIDPDGSYVYANVDDEQWFVSMAAVEKLKLQGHDITVTEAVSGEALVGETVENPITGESIIVLPAGFVDPDNATGVVMSVPAHSPDDYIALQEAKQDPDRLKTYGVDMSIVDNIEPVPVLTIEDYGEIPAKDAVEQHGIESSDDPELETATKELYNREFHQGVLNQDYGEFAGEVIEEARDAFREAYTSTGAFGSMQEFSENVVCRCGGGVVVAEQDTWFLRYNDEDWKQRAHTLVSQMEAIPENTRSEYDYTIDWLNEWPCIRNYGLGTRLPFDDDFVIEPLSDSTIYMSYYAIAHRLRDIPVEDLDRDFFDTLFYGSQAVENPDERALSLHEEWDYWYPVDYRFSANDLISNHLTFYLFHHAELFEPAQWPEGIVIMGMGLLEGEKMSSSKGHVVLPDVAIEEYGADTVRFFLLNSAEPWQDYDWRDEQVGSVRDQLERFWNRAQGIIRTETPPSQPSLRPIDNWLLSRLQRTIQAVTTSLEAAETRTASQAAFYDFEEDLRWYHRRTTQDRPGAQWIRQQVLSTRLRLLAPLIPFITNELHEQLMGQSAEMASWPAVDDNHINRPLEASETQIGRLVDDIQDIQQSLSNADEYIPAADPDHIEITTAPSWHRTVFESIVKEGADQAEVMSTIMQNPELRKRGNAVNDLVGELVKFARGRDEKELEALASVNEEETYRRAITFLEREFDATINISQTTDASASAIPFRPEIDLQANQ